MRKIFKYNAFWNLAEVALSSVMLFVLYRLILDKLGVTSLGIWSIVLATTSMARVADLGAAGGLGRYVALSQAQNRPGDNALIYVETALITNAILYVMLGAALYYPAWWALARVTSGAALDQARALLPYAFGSFIMQNISTVIASALIGFGRSNQKSMVMLATLSVQGVTALSLVDHVGLRGVAIAQIVQYSLLVIIGWLLASRAALGSIVIRIPCRLERNALKDLVGFGVKLQGLNLASFLYEPATKFALTSTLGLGALGLYELASRGVLQLRQLVIAPTQNLTPIFTSTLHGDPTEIKNVYEKSFINLSAFAAVAMLTIGAGAPFISILWLKKIDSVFVLYSAILAAGWLINMVSIPGYYLGIASGRLRWNIVGGAFTAMISPSAAYLLGKWLGGPAAVAGVMLGVAGGAAVTAIMNCRDSKLNFVPKIATFPIVLVHTFGAFIK